MSRRRKSKIEKIVKKDQVIIEPEVTSEEGEKFNKRHIGFVCDTSYNPAIRRRTALVSVDNYHGGFLTYQIIFLKKYYGK